MKNMVKSTEKHDFWVKKWQFHRLKSAMASRGHSGGHFPSFNNGVKNEWQSWMKIYLFVNKWVVAGGRGRSSAIDGFVILECRNVVIVVVATVGFKTIL